MSGIFIKNIHRHEVASTMDPPTNGPMTAASDDQAVQRPIAWPRLSFGKLVLIIAKAPGTSKAPKIPCKIRMLINVAGLGDRPQTKEAAPKPTSPNMYIRFRPNTSPKEPPSRIRADKESK